MNSQNPKPIEEEILKEVLKIGPDAPIVIVSATPMVTDTDLASLTHLITNKPKSND